MAIGNTWTNVTSRTITKGSATVTFWIDVKLNRQDIAGNYSVVDTRLTSTITNNLAGSGYKFTLTGASDLQGDGVWTFSNTTILTGQTTVYHTNPNSDGTKTSSVSASVYNRYWSINESFSGNYVLPKIDRYPMLLTAPDFNDEANPKITYTNILGLTGATVQAKICNSAGTTAYITKTLTSTDISNGEYTFNLTTAERNTLRNATPNSDTMQVKFRLITTASGTNYEGDVLTKTLTIINANPTMKYTITETNAKVSALLGTSANTIVQNASILNFNVTPTTYKGATVKRVLCGNRYDMLNRISKETSPYSINIPVKEENTFMVVTYDSRWNTVEDLNIQKTIIEYKPVSINSFSFTRQDQTSSNIILNLDAVYYQKTFGSTANVPIVKYKLDNGSWNTIPSSSYTISNNKLKITNYTLPTTLDYSLSGTFYIYIEDKLSTTQNSKQVTKGIATLELGENDVKVNGSFETTGNTKIDGELTSVKRATLKQGSIVGRFSSGSGTTGYMKVATLVVDQTYMNEFIIFEVTQRTRHGIVYLQFAGGNSKDPAISKLEVDGTTKAYMYRTATSTWDLYIQKSEGYDHIDIVRLHKGIYSDKITITWNGDGETVSSLPEGYVGSTTYNMEVLYNSSSGTNGEVTLSSSSANYSYLEIFYRSNNSDYNSVRVYSPNGKDVQLSIMHPTSTSVASAYFKAKTVTISANKITNKYYCEVALTNGSNITLTASNYIYITRVIGYK